MRNDPLVRAATAAGVTDARVLRALADVSRAGFAPPGADVRADAALPLTHGQTTSQPSLVALMLEALRLTPESRVLEVGTGYGYQAALLSRLAAEIWTLERVPELAEQAVRRLAAAGAVNVRVVVGDGSRGLPEHAPYDGIVVAAQAAQVPTALLDQLTDGGRLVVPVGDDERQQCRVLARRNSVIEEVDGLGSVRFVPLVLGDVIGSDLDD